MGEIREVLEKFVLSFLPDYKTLPIKYDQAEKEIEDYYKKKLGEIDIEMLAEQVHKAYCQYCIDVKGTEYWSKGNYNKLTDNVKEADRYTARAVLKTIIDWLEEI